MQYKKRLRHIGMFRLLILLAAIVALPIFAEAQSGSQTIAQTAMFEADTVELMDSNGESVGEGQHSGEQRCLNDHCFKKTQLNLTGGVMIEYRFETQLVLDANLSLVIVDGTGTISNGAQKEKFQFTAYIQDNGDDTLSVTYSASRPDTSFIIANTLGTFEVSSLP